MSTQSSDNNKRIAKNTLLLCFRMLFMMLVSLYTSRVILNALGVEDKVASVNPCHLWETTTHPTLGRSDKSVINIYTSSIHGIGAIRVRNIKTRKHY